MNRRFYLALAAQALLQLTAVRGEDKVAGNILIDASKDGGKWWSPQSQAFDATADHQGKFLADALRDKGYKVEELGRGVEVTHDMLRSASLVIRPTVETAYSEAEIDAYRKAITEGLPAILFVQASVKDDVLANKMGFEFSATQEIARPSMIRNHALAEGLETMQGPLTPFIKMPNDAVAFGSTASGRPVAALRVVNRSPVVVLGLPMRDCKDIMANITAQMLAAPGADLKRQLVSSRPGRPNENAPARSLTPVLTSPAKGAELRHGAGATWRFEWKPAPDAVEYELIVSGPSASIPLINTKTTKTFHEHVFGAGYISARNRENWTWSVRAKDSKGVWGEWAVTRKFDVE